ncbi:MULTISPECIES: DNA-methyltransferase [Bacillus cereus group]|uniref:DNA-methyltransferase n=1 Tax=Bacillus cereus group TaxID=86661 RepID=UPI0013D531C4|nr:MULTISPECIES: site-specific DNA-methyltransferase [Bacillus cereus group]MDX5816189.1 site-specific DNA-methyltransferase [Bacillus cereus group sp. BfR-BA-01665]MDX5861412.1 site-specific DNA-methyltransferase [Bacillus cereus group sp. BfR-BA-02138]MDX5920842.1 site-specific DNA-methyltransferase [Bacillus cereus group sp. BfR-BA-01033]MDX5973367.1 site-specific DNA-methyltransferase [Bacillus cereus group sp. BfR-BA-00287]
MSKILVSEKRNYFVKTVAEAKEISTNYLSQEDIKDVEFGLPEIDDRYDIWRVPLLSVNKAVLGYIIIDAKTGDIDKKKTTKKEVIYARLSFNSQKEDKQKGNKKIKYPISPLSNMILKGDSREILDTLPSESVDLIFTSPPYFNARTEYSDYATYDEYLEVIRQVIRKSARVLVEGRFFVMNVSPVLIPRASRSEASKRIAVPFDMHRLFIEEGFEFMDDIIWQKPEGAGWASGRGRRFSADRNPLQYKPVPVTENILVYRKKSDKLIDWFIRKHPNQDLIQDSKVGDDYEKTNIWYISPARDKRHRAIFPKELARKVIQYYSFKNDVVLDPFGGIGTTGKAAADLERRFVLIEKEEEYIEATINDLQQLYFDIFDDIEIKR